MKHQKTPTPAWPLGALTPGKPGRHFILPEQNFPAPARICNASSEGIYSGERWALRPGSDHRHLPSKGGC